MEQIAYLLVICSLISAGAALWVDLGIPFLVQPHAWVYSGLLLALTVLRCDLAVVCAAVLTVLLYYPLVAFAADHQHIAYPGMYVFVVAVAANTVALLAAAWCAAGTLLHLFCPTTIKAGPAEASV